MGPISKYKVMITIAVYGTQVDICGTFKAHSMHHKRTAKKVWLTVYCCMSTSTTSVKVMDDYSTLSFMQSFIRFSCEFGYQKFMLIHEGSQLAMVEITVSHQL